MADKKEDSAVEFYSFAGTSVPSEYLNLVRSRWVRSYKKDNAFMRLVHTPSYYFSYNNYVAMILKRPATSVMVAVLQEDNDVVLGFSVTEGKILHYIHVPKAYRRQGIGTLLVPEGIEWTTHLTTIGMKIWSTKGHGVKFHPFL